MSIAWNRNRFAQALIAAAPATFRRRTARWLAAWVFAIVAAAAPPGRSEPADMVAIEHQRQTIYHSPQKPGFTSWCGAWTMPDGSLMVSFTQATGPVEGSAASPQGGAAEAERGRRRASRIRHDGARPAQCPSPFDRRGEDLEAGQCRRVQVVHERRHGRGPDGPGRWHGHSRCAGVLPAVRPGAAEDRLPGAFHRRLEDLGQARSPARPRRNTRPGRGASACCATVG